MREKVAELHIVPAMAEIVTEVAIAEEAIVEDGMMNEAVMEEAVMEVAVMVEAVAEEVATVQEVMEILEAAAVVDTAVRRTEGEEAALHPVARAVQDAGLPLCQKMK